MNATPLRWWSGTALAAAVAAVEPAWLRWCVSWNVSPGPVVASNAFDATEADRLSLRWQRCKGKGRAAAWLGFASAAPTEALRALLFETAPGVATSRGFGASGSIAQEVAEAAWCDLEDEIARLLPTLESSGLSSGSTPQADPSPPASDWQPWSGAVALRLGPGHGPAVFLHLTGPSAELLLRSHVPASGTERLRSGDLTQLGEAIGRKVVQLSVELDGLALDLGTLQTLRPGDVLALRHRLDEPLRVCLPRDKVTGGAGPALCSALLGARNGRRAIELVPEDAPA